MVLTEIGWKNKAGTGGRVCRCGSWQQHWINFTRKPWPTYCSVVGCFNAPTLGAHLINQNVEGEWIVPLCESCNKRGDVFNLKDGTTVESANTSQTCKS